MADADALVDSAISTNPTWYQRLFRSIGGNDDPTTKEFWTKPNPDIQKLAEAHQQTMFSQIPREYASGLINAIPGTIGLAGTIFDWATKQPTPSLATRIGSGVETATRDYLGLPDEYTWARVIGNTLSAATPISYIPNIGRFGQTALALTVPYNFIRRGHEAADVATQGVIAGGLQSGAKLVLDALHPARAQQPDGQTAPAVSAPAVSAPAATAQAAAPMSEADRLVAQVAPPQQPATNDADRLVQMSTPTPRQEGDSYIDNWKTYAGIGAAGLLAAYGGNKLLQGILKRKEDIAGAIPRTQPPDMPDPQNLRGSFRTGFINQNQFVKDVLDKGLTDLGKQINRARGRPDDFYDNFVKDIMNRIATRTGTGGAGQIEHTLATGRFAGTDIQMEISPARLQSMAAALKGDERTVLYDALHAGNIIDQRRLFNQKLVQQGKVAIPDNVPWTRGMLQDKTTSELAQMYARGVADPKLGSIISGYKDVMRKTLEYYVRKGILTRDAANGLLADRPNYVHRATDTQVEGFINKMKAGFRSPEVDDNKMMTDLQSLLKRRDIDLKSTLDPMTAMDKQIHNAIHLAETNSIKRDIIAMSTEHVTDANGNKVPLHNASKYFEKVGTATDKAGNELMSAEPDAVLVRMGDGTTTKYKAPLELATVMRFAPAASVPFMNQMRKFEQWKATGPGNPLWATIVAPIYDVMASTIVTKIFDKGKLNFVPGYDTIKGFGHTVYGKLMNEMAHQLYRQADSGGMLSSVIGKPAALAAAHKIQHAANNSVFNLSRELGVMSHSRDQAIWGRSVLGAVAPDVNIAKNVTPVARYAVEAANIAWRGYTGFLGAIQDATKVGYFARHSGKQGMELTEAAAKARDVVGDFAQTPMNKYMQALESVVPYSRVGVVGADKFVRAWRENPVAVTLKGVGAVSTPMVGGAMMMTLTSPEHRDFYWNKLTDFQRASGFWFPTGPDPTRSLYIPIEPVTGVLFGVTALVASDALFGMSNGKLEGDPGMRKALAKMFNVPDDVANGAAFKPLTHAERWESAKSMALQAFTRANPFDVPTAYNYASMLMGGQPASVRHALTDEGFFKKEFRPTAEGTRYEGGVFSEKAFKLTDGFFGMLSQSLLNSLEAAHETKMYTGSTGAANERFGSEFKERTLTGSPARIMFDLPVRLQSKTLESEQLKGASDNVDKIHELFGKFIRNEPGIKTGKSATTDATPRAQFKTPEFAAIGGVVQRFKPQLDKIQSDIATLNQIKSRMEISAQSPGAFKSRTDALNAQMRDISRRRQDALNAIDAAERAVSRELGGRPFRFRDFDPDAEDLGLSKMN